MDAGQNDNLKEARELADKIQKSFDATALVLAELVNEIATTQEKYGTESRIVKKKKEQLTALRDLYDNSLAYINFLREQNFSMYMDFSIQELCRVQRETGMPFINIARLLDWKNPERWHNVDKFNDLICKLRDKLKVEQENPFDELTKLFNRQV